MFSTLERHQKAVANLLGIGEGFEARREWLPFVVAEIKLMCPQSDDEIVVAVFDPFFVNEDNSLFRVDADDLTENDRCVFMLMENVPDRGRDVALGKSRRRDLIEHRLK